MNIKKGDNVKVITGKDRGKSGKVLRIFGRDGRVLVDGLNMAKKSVKPKKQGQKGEIVSVSRPMHASNVMILCASCKKAVRLGSRMEGDKKVRYCRNCNADID